MTMNFRPVTTALAAATLLSSVSFAGAGTRYHETIAPAPVQQCWRILLWSNCAHSLSNTHGLSNSHVRSSRSEGGPSHSVNGTSSRSTSGTSPASAAGASSRSESAGYSGTNSGSGNSNGGSQGDHGHQGGSNGGI